MTNVNILLVDDSPENLLALEAILDSPEYSLYKATSGDDALRCLLDNDFAVILLDVRMPNMDGFETAELIRGRQRSYHVPIIFLTGFEAGNLFKGYSLGAVDYLVKPVVPEILRAKVAVFAELFRKTQDLQYQLEQIRALKHDVRERKMLLSREQAARAEAEQAVRERDEFLSVAAHELKTPVTSLRGFAQLMLRQMERNKTLDPDRVHHAFEAIDQQSSKLAHLVSQLLDISRIESGQLKLDKEAINIIELMANVLNMIQPATNKHTFVVNMPDSISTVADPLRLEQVFTNLLDNAIKYSPEGGPIRVDMCIENGNTICAAVTDSGIGIPPEHREHIFDRFYRAHSSSHFGGMGLGLHISRQIVLMHDGTLQAEFPPEGGTRFVIRLPIETVPQNS